MIQADLRKEWISQATINFADDEELLALAAKAGCRGVFIGFETLSPEGLRELGKKFNLLRDRDFPASVQRIQRHKIQVVGSFILGLDVDKPGIGKRIAEVAGQYGVDNLNILFLTPLPGTKLWDKMKAEGRIVLDTFPHDWQYYTLTFPMARYRHLSLDESIDERLRCGQRFYSTGNTLSRIWGNLWRWRNPFITVVANFSCRGNLRLDSNAYADFRREHAHRYDPAKAGLLPERQD